MQVAVAGEALIDMANTGPLAFQGHVGGGPLNSAVAYVRMGHPCGFITQLSTALGQPVQTGKFGAMMQVALVNDGPVTLIIDSKSRD